MSRVVAYPRFQRRCLPLEKMAESSSTSACEHEHSSKLSEATKLMLLQALQKLAKHAASHFLH